MNDPEIVRFCNEELRPCMDAVGRAYWRVKKLLALYEAKALAAKVGDGVEPIDDGSAHDGRSPITTQTVRLTLANIGGIVAALETPDPATGYPLVAGVLSIAVNTD